MIKKRGLGKGLQALIPDVEEIIPGRDKLKEIDIEKIRPTIRQARQVFDQEKLAELAASIREHGVIQPVVVRPLPDGGYELIAGERRWRACKTLGYETIPAVVRDYQDLEATAVSLIENVQREDLNPLEEATAYRQLMEEFGLTQEEVSGRVGKSRPFVANMVRILGLPDEVKDMLSSGKISAGHARALLAIRDGKKQLAAAGRIARLQLSVRQAEKIAKSLLKKNKESKDKKVSVAGNVLQAEEILKNFLGTKVKIRESGGSGKVEISYNNEADLQRIMEIVLGEYKA